MHITFRGYFLKPSLTKMLHMLSLSRYVVLLLVVVVVPFIKMANKDVTHFGGYNIVRFIALFLNKKIEIVSKKVHET